MKGAFLNFPDEVKVGGKRTAFYESGAIIRGVFYTHLESSNPFLICPSLNVK